MYVCVYEYIYTHNAMSTSQTLLYEYMCAHMYVGMNICIHNAMCASQTQLYEYMCADMYMEYMYIDMYVQI